MRRSFGPILQQASAVHCSFKLMLCVASEAFPPLSISKMPPVVFFTRCSQTVQVAVTCTYAITTPASIEAGHNYLNLRA